MKSTRGLVASLLPSPSKRGETQTFGAVSNASEPERVDDTSDANPVIVGDRCTDCRRLEQRLEEEVEFQYTFKGSFPELHRSAAAGCGPCRLLRQQILYRCYFPEALERQNDQIEVKKSGLIFYLRYNSTTIPLELIEGDAETPPTMQPSNQIQLLRSAGDPSTVEELNETGLSVITGLSKHWISECLENHKTCTIPHQSTIAHVRVSPPGGDLRQPPLLPTRVVDVGDSGGLEAPTLFVPEAETFAEYTAISYCWGDSTPTCQLTSSTMQQLKKRIELSTLCRTIRDAILFTRRLGVRYLWVDALCIIQAERPLDTIHMRDWEAEAKSFGRYYKDSLCTISATAASSSDNGLFLTRPGLDFRVKPCHLRCKAKDHSVRGATLASTPPFWHFQIKYSPLQRRGWAFQERLISTRNIHFARDSVLWECCELKASESHPGGIEPFRGRIPESDYILNTIDSLKDLVTFQDSVDPDKAYNSWARIVTQFTGTNFSFFRDRLPAISGLAKRFQRVLNDEYYAGLWSGSLETGLAWHAMSTSREPNPGCEGYRGPSWSWAACWFRVLSCPDWKPEVRVLTVHVDSEEPSSNVDGFVNGGRVRIRGRVAQFDLASMGYSQVAGWKNTFRVAAYESESEVVDVSGDIMELNLDRYLDPPLSLQSVVCLRMVSGKNDYGKNSAGSIVLRATGRRDGDIQEFTRIGFIFLPRRVWMKKGVKRTIDIV